VHGLFQSFVRAYRPQVDLDRVATGETWHGEHAIDLALIDELCTSDAYLLAASEEADLFEVRWVEHKRPIDRLMAQVESRLDAAAERWIARLTNWRTGA
jgi:serine protease SohB